MAMSVERNGEPRERRRNDRDFLREGELAVLFTVMLGTGRRFFLNYSDLDRLQTEIMRNYRI
jgi:hypothetical protein